MPVHVPRRSTCRPISCQRVHGATLPVSHFEGILSLLLPRSPPARETSTIACSCGSVCTCRQAPSPVCSFFLQVESLRLGTLASGQSAAPVHRCLRQNYGMLPVPIPLWLHMFFQIDLRGILRIAPEPPAVFAVKACRQKGGKRAWQECRPGMRARREKGVRRASPERPQTSRRPAPAGERQWRRPHTGCHGQHPGAGLPGHGVTIRHAVCRTDPPTRKGPAGRHFGQSGRLPVPAAPRQCGAGHPSAQRPLRSRERNQRGHQSPAATP